MGYGSDDLPAFWSRQSGLKVPLRLDDPATIAGFLKQHFALGLGGALIANPVPAADEIPRAEMAGYIEQALNDAAAAGIVGKEVTPFLLAHIGRESGGRSLETNIALVKNNARLAARIARAFV